MAAVTVAAAVCHHISCHMHVHFYVFEQFAANMLCVDAIAPFGRNSFLLPLSRVSCFPEPNHTRTHMHWKNENSAILDARFHFE